MYTIIYKTKLIPDFSIKEYILADELLFKNKYEKLFEEQGRTFKTYHIDDETKTKIEQNIELLEKEYKNRSTSDYIHESILEPLFEDLTNPYYRKIKEWLDTINSLSIDFEKEILIIQAQKGKPMTEIKFVKLLDKNKFAFTARDEWRTIEITNTLGSEYVNISPYYMLDTNEYDMIENVNFIDILNELEPELLKIFKTKFKVKLELIKLITEVK